MHNNTWAIYVIPKKRDYSHDDTVSWSRFPSHPVVEFASPFHDAVELFKTKPHEAGDK